MGRNGSLQLTAPGNRGLDPSAKRPSAHQDGEAGAESLTSTSCDTLSQTRPAQLPLPPWPSEAV